ncbi:hypothetical protein K469DRAFT_183250 [Zopfia rhizophila CBS 207.26]|uniref:Uncharacterized protein n=1 Tax=Zopfia rhizophila CBS 207.26 TaxID=1314779 RepID=A0A6A6DZF0_9PEZI|nr:hypothetical protein K469DRAFT_183250 [Zopfia rhizophila CBS 207.26]
MKLRASCHNHGNMSMYLFRILQEPKLLVLITITKITDSVPLERILERTLVYQAGDPSQEKAKRFACLAWLQDVLENSRTEDTISGLKPWDEIEQATRNLWERRSARAGEMLGGRGIGRWD